MTKHYRIWHPFTPQKDSPAPLKIIRGKGSWLELKDGRCILDCISSWWVTIHGHAHPYIARKIYNQAQSLEHAIFSGFTHQRAEDLGKRIIELLPHPLNTVFFSDNGSTSVEVALKIAIQYWKNQGQKREKLMCFKGAYHGDTFGAMSAAPRTIFTQAFEPFLFRVEHVGYPHYDLKTQHIEKTEQQILSQIEHRLKKHKTSAGYSKYAAILIEPLIQGTAGMKICREHFLQELSKLCQQYDCLLIFDEVMTGFGRSGYLFAALRSKVTPDIICLSKGLTGGFLPLALTICSEKIYLPFFSSKLEKTFWHGHSYTANPLGCQAALASLDLLIQTPAPYCNFESWHHEFLPLIYSHPLVESPRVCGTIMAFTVKSDQPYGYQNKQGTMIRDMALERNLLLRPLGNHVYIMPPYCTTKKEISTIYHTLLEILDELPLS